MLLLARSVVGYHGCEQKFAEQMLLGTSDAQAWQPSANDWDWLGQGIYFWEHSPERALRWAKERYTKPDQQPAVLGAILQLGRCFDLLDESITALLAETYTEMAESYAAQQMALPRNRGRGGKLRELDCLVINKCIDRMKLRGDVFDTTRGAFLEGEPVYPTAGFSSESHVQIAVRNSACIVGVFRPMM